MSSSEKCEHEGPTRLKNKAVRKRKRAAKAMFNGRAPSNRKMTRHRNGAGAGSSRGY